MKKSSIKLAFLLLSLAYTSSCLAQTLRIGSKAPAITVGSWIKGGEVNSFKPGDVYVVEFWATWCVPCKQTIPHLTQLAQKYVGKATFIGASVFEHPESGQPYSSTLPKVKSFVASMGDRMEYHIATDDDNKDMAKSWMAPSGQAGIPTAFVVDQDGRIAWIGYSTVGAGVEAMEKTLESVTNGTFDRNAAIAKSNAELEVRRANEEKNRVEAEKEKKAYAQWLLTPLGLKFANASALTKDKKYQEALAVYDDIATSQPDQRIADTGLAAAECKMTIYEKIGDMKNYYANGRIVFRIWSEQAQKSLDKGTVANNGGRMSEVDILAYEMNDALAWPTADPQSKFKEKDFAFAIEVAKRAVQLTHRRNPNWLDTLACAYFGIGEKHKAIATEEEAIRLFKGDVDEGFTANLALFQRKK